MILWQVFGPTTPTKNVSGDGSVVENVRVTETLACLLGRRRLLPLAMSTSCTAPTPILRALFYAMHILGSSIWGTWRAHRRRKIIVVNRFLSVGCCRSGTFLMTRHRARRPNLSHQQKPQAPFLHLATHSLRRPTPTRQNTCIHQQQHRYPVENAHADWRRFGLSARILREAAATQVPLPPSQPRSGTRKSYNSIEVALSLARARNHRLERLSTPRRWPIGSPELSVSNEVTALLLVVSSWTEISHCRCEKDIRSFLKNRKTD